MERTAKRAACESNQVRPGDLKSRRIAIVGAGKVGTAIGHTLQARGFNIVSVAGRSRASLDRSVHFIDCDQRTADIVEAAKTGDLILITTSDDEIKKVCSSIAHERGFSPGDVVLHLSGALSVRALQQAQSAGAHIGSIHPMQSFATVEGAIQNLPGSVFGVTADEDVMPLAREIVEALGGKSITVADGDKALYHAAACVASNYFVALVHFAQSIHKALGVSEDVALEALFPLIKGTLANIESQGPAQALTGPIARGDLGPIKEHLEAFNNKMPGAKELYCELGKYTAKVAREKGTIDGDKQDQLNQLLKGGVHEQQE